jgi:hypothetical protein
VSRKVRDGSPRRRCPVRTMRATEHSCSPRWHVPRAADSGLSAARAPCTTGPLVCVPVCACVFVCASVFVCVSVCVCGGGGGEEEEEEEEEALCA